MAGPFLHKKESVPVVVPLLSLPSVTECFVVSGLVLSVLLAMPTRMLGTPRQWCFTSGYHILVILSTVRSKEMNEQCQCMHLNVRTNKWRAVQARNKK